VRIRFQQTNAGKLDLKKILIFVAFFTRGCGLIASNGVDSMTILGYTTKTITCTFNYCNGAGKPATKNGAEKPAIASAILIGSAALLLLRV
jgi:hypothetical protein